MSIKLDDGVAIPKGRGIPLLLRTMKIGQSFLVPGKLNTVQAAMYREQKATGKRFTTRQTPEGVRCWRRR